MGIPQGVSKSHFKHHYLSVYFLLESKYLILKKPLIFLRLDEVYFFLLPYNFLQYNSLHPKQCPVRNSISKFCRCFPSEKGSANTFLANSGKWHWLKRQLVSNKKWSEMHILSLRNLTLNIKIQRKSEVFKLWCFLISTWNADFLFITRKMPWYSTCQQ